MTNQRTPPIRLGFMTHIEGDGDPRRIYDEALELFVAADQLGIDVAWVAQHHFKERSGRLPSPFPFLAAAAQRTRSLRLGTAIVILPLENPLRVAEDAAVVDALSRGRLELGIGSGGDPDEFDAFRVSLDTRHTQTSNGFVQLRQAFCGEDLGIRGQRLQPPAPTLVDRVWQSAVSAGGATHVAANGAGLLLARAAFKAGHTTDTLQLPVAEAFVEAWRGRTVAPRIGVSRGIYPAQDKRTALAALRTDVLANVQDLVAHGQLPAAQSLEQYCAWLNIAYGHPDEVAAALRSDCVLPYATDLILQFNPAVPPLGLAIRMLEQIVTDIAPQIGWQPQTCERESAQVSVERIH